jgi:tetrahydromethanopterin S-methyltransferase subunit H
MKLFGIALALVCCGASAAKADWEYTKWGMTPQQVVSAAKNRTKKSSDLHPDSDGNVTKLVAPYQSGKFSFEAQFGFDATDRLSSVTLVLDDKSAGMDMDMDMGADMNMDQGVCHDLQVSVKTTYGPPQGGGSAHMQYSIETWQDQKNKNNVTYTVLDGVGCYVQYSAIKSAGAH